MINEPGIGRKIFFLYPHNIIKDIITEIVRNEYEAYILENHIIALKFLVKYKDSILFINIDAIFKEEDWEEYIKNIILNPETKDTRIGVLTYYEKSKDIIEKYLIDLGVHCGFIHIKMEPEKCLQIILKTLEANEARGRRRCIRAICNNKLDTFNIMYGNERYEGTILDISIAGIACCFNNKDSLFKVNTVLPNIQLVLRGASCILTGKVMQVKKRMQGNDVYIIMFDREKIKPEIEKKMHNFIYKSLQEWIKEEITQIA